MKIRLPKEEPEPFRRTPELPVAITKEYLNSIWGNITVYGVKHMADGRQWVIHCLTGQPMEREHAKPIKDNRGNILWIGTNETLSPLDRPEFQTWKNPDHPTI